MTAAITAQVADRDGVLQAAVGALMALDIAIECADGLDVDTHADRVTLAAEAALAAAACFDEDTEVELSVRLVDAAESAKLNGEWRDKPHATNVLSFPAEVSLPGLAVLGDLVICMPVVEAEAAAQDKTVVAHFEHMIVHGILHLLGHDHIGDDEAERMEDIERRVMAELGHDDPYRERAPV